MTFAGVAGPERVQRVDLLPDAEQVRYLGLDVQGEGLRQVAHLRWGGDAARRGGKFTGDQAQESGLAGPVEPDQTRTSGVEAAGDTRQGDRTVRPGQADVAQNDG